MAYLNELAGAMKKNRHRSHANERTGLAKHIAGRAERDGITELAALTRLFVRQFKKDAGGKMSGAFKLAAQELDCGAASLRRRATSLPDQKMTLLDEELSQKMIAFLLQDDVYRRAL